MINTNKEIFKWGPIDGRLIMASYFTIAIAKDFPEKYGVFWPEIAFYFRKGKMVFLCEYEKLRSAGKKVFGKYILNQKKCQEIWCEWQKEVKALINFQKQITPEKLKNQDDEALLKTYLEWQRLYFDFWLEGLVPEISNWGAERILMKKLKEIVKNEEEYLHYLEVLASPTKPSFFQEAERDLCIAALQRKDKEKFEKILEKYANKYFWLSNSYFETKVLKPSYFRETIEEKIKEGIDFRDEIEKINNFSKKVKKGKTKIIKELKLDRKTRRIIDALAECIWWQDLRKSYIFQANHYLVLFLREIARRKKLNYLFLMHLWPNELTKVIKGGKVPLATIKNRKKLVVARIVKGKVELLTKKRARAVVKMFEPKTDYFQGILKGLVVSKGASKVKSKVRILKTPRQIKSMKKGEVLVASMTSPDYIIALKKASAVVTDEGGMTSHAAIVSRELGLPCIVYTKIATRVLKTGDLVEVDTRKGVIKKL